MKKKIGRPYVPAMRGDKTVIATVVRPDIKNRLIEFARTNERTLSRECEVRLEQSFRDEWLLDEIRKMWEARE